MLSTKDRVVRHRHVLMVGNQLATRKNGSRTSEIYVFRCVTFLPCYLIMTQDTFLSDYIHIFQTTFALAILFHFIITLTIWNRFTVIIIPILKMRKLRHKWHELGPGTSSWDIYPRNYFLPANSPSSSSSFFCLEGTEI